MQSSFDRTRGSDIRTPGRLKARVSLVLVLALGVLRPTPVAAQPASPSSLPLQPRLRSVPLFVTPWSGDSTTPSPVSFAGSNFGSAAGRGALIGAGIGLTIGLVGFAIAANSEVVFDPVALTVGYTAAGVVAGTGVAALLYLLPRAGVRRPQGS